MTSQDKKTPPADPVTTRPAPTTATAQPRPGEPRDESALESFGRSISEVVTGPNEDPGNPEADPAKKKSTP